MLVLSRDCDTVIRIGDDIRVKVLSIRRRRVKLGIDAPSNVRVWREEICPERHPEQDLAQKPPPDKQVGGDEFPILVVEDDPDHARLICKVLNHSQFSRITIARTGTEAIDALAGRGQADAQCTDPHLVLLDLHLPDMSGLEVLRRIRSSDRLQTTPVVMLSAEQEDGRIADCLEAGANAFVNKAVRFDDFYSTVSRIANFWKSDCRIPRS